MSLSPSLPGLDITTLEEKIALAEEFIVSAYEKNDGKVFISWSGGKDSTVLMFIALRLYPDIKIVFSNTTNELKEVLKYVKNIHKIHPRFKNINLHVVHPVISFTQILRTVGLPLVSKEVSQKVSEMRNTNGKKTRITRVFGNPETGNGKLSEKWNYLAEERYQLTAKCCDLLKKNPLEKFAKEHGGLKPIIGLMNDEGSLRRQLELFGPKEDSRKIYPFLYTGFCEEDIWSISSYYGFRFAECYYDSVLSVNGVPTVIKARKRTGCEYCGFGITLEKEDRFARSKLTSPKRFEKMMSIENNGVTFGEAIAIVKSDKRHPILGIPGVRYERAMVFEREGFSIKMNFATSSTMTKKCTRCESRRLEKAFGHYGNFADSPDPETGKHRRVFITSENGYDCVDCGATVVDDLHLFDKELCVTMRLIKYVEKNMSKKSFHEMVALTGATFDTLYDIAKKIQREERRTA